MKSRLILSLVLSFTLIQLYAQHVSAPIYKEIYLTTSGLTTGNYGIQYKVNLKNNHYFRIAAIRIQADYRSIKPETSNTFPSSYFSFEGSFEMGLERRVEISDRLQGFYGIDLVYGSYTRTHRSNDPNLPLELRKINDLEVSPGLGFTSGFILQIKDNFFVAAEISPKILFEYSRNEMIVDNEIAAETNAGLALDLSNQSIRLSLIYRWKKG